MKELTIEELKQMAGQPVWCPEEEAYGIVMCDKIGQWAGIPFLHGVWYSGDDGVGSEKYSEIILLGQMLQERKIEHEQHDLYDGYQITVPLPEPTKEISVIEHQCSYGSIMNSLEIWADGSIQGYLSAKQTLRIIERIKARESPR